MWLDVAILLDENTRVLIQGITGREGTARTRFMKAYGTKVVAGVTPGKGGQSLGDTPVYDSVCEAIEAQGKFDATVTFVSAPQVKAAVVEALEAGIKLIIMPVERVPLHDTLELVARAKKVRARILGPGSFGIISPGKSVAGWIGGNEEFAREMFPPGNVGVISRSGGQTTTLAWAIGQAGLGISTAVHTGSEPIIGTTPAELLRMFQSDDETQAIALFGEIGTVAEEEAAEIIAAGEFTKPLVAFIAGVGIRPGMRFSHASAIIEHGRGTAESKIQALRQAGARAFDRPEELAQALVCLT